MDTDEMQIVYRNEFDGDVTVNRQLAFMWRRSGVKVSVSVRVPPDFEDTEWKEFADPYEAAPKIVIGW